MPPKSVATKNEVWAIVSTTSPSPPITGDWTAGPIDVSSYTGLLVDGVPVIY